MVLLYINKPVGGVCQQQIGSYGPDLDAVISFLKSMHSNKKYEILQIPRS